MSTGSLSEETQRYIRDKQIEPLMENLLHDLLLALPPDPLAYLEQLLENNPTPKIIVMGPPSSGKTTQSDFIRKLTGAIPISISELLKSEVDASTEVGKAVASYRSKNALVPDSLMIELLKDRLAQRDIKQSGWCLDGFPQTRSQAIGLQLAGIIPSLFIVLDIPDSVVMERCSRRRIDPVTGNLYDILKHPPPSDVAVEVRAEDRPEGIEERLGSYHRNMAEVISCYPSARVHISANRPVENVLEDVQQELNSRLVKIG